MEIQAKRFSGVVKLSRKYKLDNVDLQGKSREGTKKRALENGDKKHKNYRDEIWAGGALLCESCSEYVIYISFDVKITIS